MRITLTILLLCFSQSVSAIVVRHDVDAQKYLADASDFPALATFYIDGAHGVLIKPDWIVTAAHTTFCITPGSDIRILDTYHKVDSVFVHKGYQPGTRHDIALIKLVDSVKGVTPARLYEQPDELGKNIWFIGTGGTGNGLTGQTEDNVANAGVLRKAQNSVEFAQGPLLTFTFDSGDSALPLEGVSGGGDSGGPAYVTLKGIHYLLGISSRVDGGEIGKYGVVEVYSRVSFFTAWIEDITSGDAKLQQQFALPKLDKLPAGLTVPMLAEVCAEIGLKPSL